MTPAPGSIAAHDNLALAYARFLLADSAFDSDPTAGKCTLADAAWLAVVRAAADTDTNSLKAPNTRDWVERRLANYRALTGSSDAELARCTDPQTITQKAA